MCKSTCPYSIRRVDGDEESDTLRELHDATSSFPSVDFGEGWWWIVYFRGEPIAYSGIVQSTYPNAVYFKRVGVMPGHRGQNIQFRLMRVMERFARRIGYDFMVSDTTGTVHSANNFVKAQWKLFDPAAPWAFATTLYWYKDLTKCR